MLSDREQSEDAARAAGVVGQTLRDFSPIGPCLPQGEITRETPTMIVVAERHGGKERRIMKAGQRWRARLLHVAPCPSCTDHPRTQYPRGYED
jgi:hypothetical protein